MLEFQGLAVVGERPVAGVQRLVGERPISIGPRGWTVELNCRRIIRGRQIEFTPGIVRGASVVVSRGQLLPGEAVGLNYFGAIDDLLVSRTRLFTRALVQDLLILGAGGPSYQARGEQCACSNTQERGGALMRQHLSQSEIFTDGRMPAIRAH